MVDDVLRCKHRVADALKGTVDGVLHQRWPQSLRSLHQPRVSEHDVGARRTPPAVRFVHVRILLQTVLAEADGNRTRLTGEPGHYGFEDRARHQTRYASAVQPRHQPSVSFERAANGY